jgi:hypothetical protein
MEQSINAILSRLGWCRLQRKGAITRDEEEGWYAEEAGLTDALLRKDRTATTHPSLLERYRLGLEDGQALLRLSQHRNQEAVKSEIMEGVGQVRSR